MRIRRTFGLLSIALLAVACTPTLVNFAPRVHVVQSGETLFSIAWRYQLDVRELVLWNGLENPNLILVGQRLFLTPEESGGSRAANAGQAPAAPPASSGRTGSAQAETRQAGPSQPPVAVPAHCAGEFRRRDSGNLCAPAAGGRSARHSVCRSDCPSAGSRRFDGCCPGELRADRGVASATGAAHAAAVPCRVARPDLAVADSGAGGESLWRRGRYRRRHRHWWAARC